MNKDNFGYGGFWLTVNRECNNRCQWCYAQGTNFSRHNMNFQLAGQILSIMSELKIMDGIIIGGEPTLYKELLELVKLMSKLGMNSALVTNGILLSDLDFLKKLLDAGLTSVTISLKADNPENYRLLTGNRNFSKVLKALENVSKLGVRGGVSITLVKPLAKILDKVAQVAVDYGAPSLMIDIGSPAIINGEINSDFLLNPREAADCIVDHYPKIGSLNSKVTFEISLPFCLFPVGFIPMLIEKSQLISGCHLVRREGLIFDPDGNLIPCNIFTEYPLGKINSDFRDAQSLREFLRGKEVKGFYETASRLPSELCQNCAEWRFCCGGCIMRWLAFNPSDYIAKKGGD
jgi:radical SAM protein with 4Fe4S-binding SPASM domain